MAEAAERLAWVLAYARTRDAAAVCARFGISRPTLRKWWARYEREGAAGLEAASPAPRTSPQRKVFAAERDAIRALAAEGRRPAQIQAAMAARGIALSVPTIRRALAEAPAVRAEQRPPTAAGAGLFDTMLPDHAVFRGVTARITSGALKPGDALDEAALARQHRTGRRIVRAAVRSLAAIGLVSIGLAGHATVTAPPVGMIDDAYAARRLVEAQMARDLAATLGAGEIAVLRQHIRRQAEAERRGDKVSFVRLLTDFHLLLAALSANPFLQEFVRAMASITALGVLIYDQADERSCAVDEHRALVRLLEAGDGEGAAQLMSAHLDANHLRQRAR